MLTNLKIAFGRLALSLIVMLAPSAVAPARADYIVAPDVVVFCEPTLKHAVADLGALWRQETGIPVRVFVSPTWAELEQVSHRARSDLIIGEGDALASQAIDRHLVKPETLHRLWRNQLVMARSADGPKPASGPADLAGIAGKAPIAIVDPATAVAGSEGKKALQALGLWDTVSAKSVGVVDTADAAYLLANGKVQLALVYATDVAANPGFTVADTLPAASYGPIVYWIAETQNSLSPNAQKFADYLRQPQAQERLRRDGLEVLP
jgi:molybdate transport system substrate-binding protein